MFSFRMFFIWFWWMCTVKHQHSINFTCQNFVFNANILFSRRFEEQIYMNIRYTFPPFTWEKIESTCFTYGGGFFLWSFLSSCDILSRRITKKIYILFDDEEGKLKKKEMKLISFIVWTISWTPWEDYSKDCLLYGGYDEENRIVGS